MFNFKRGDTVKMFITSSDSKSIEEFVGIVLNVTDNINVRRDFDGSLFTTDLNGKMFNVNNEQYIQLQKVFNSENTYLGKRVVSLVVSVNWKETDEKDPIPYLFIQAKHPDNSTTEFSNSDLYSVSGYLDFNKEYSF